MKSLGLVVHDVESEFEPTPGREKTGWCRAMIHSQLKKRREGPFRSIRAWNRSPKTFRKQKSGQTTEFLAKAPWAQSKDSKIRRFELRSLSIEMVGTGISQNITIVKWA